MELKFAFGVNSENQFEDCFFGDAYKFLIYKDISGKLTQIDEIVNKFNSIDYNLQNNKKASNLIEYFLSNDIKVIVSKQFGGNIKIINEYFVPVIISSENPEEVVEIINAHIHWIKDELNNLNSGFKLFTIKSGILKSTIN